jgi:hypothetical protein
MKEKEQTGINTRVTNVSYSSTLNHVAHSEALNRLVLGYTARAVRAAHKSDMATAFLVTPGIPPFLGLQSKVRR